MKRSMAKHLVATLNTEVTGERGPSRPLPPLFPIVFPGGWLGVGGAEEERGRGALIKFAKVFCYLIRKARGCIK